MLDLMKYEQVVLDYPNIVALYDPEKEAEPPVFRLHENLKPLIFEAAIKHPNWVFSCGGADGGWSRAFRSPEATHNEYVGSRIFVYEGKEKLGWISWEWRGASDTHTYVIHNDRISNQRERGIAAKTKDLKKALKLIDKTFGAKTINEHVLENHKNVSSMLYMVHGDKHRRFADSYHWIAAWLTDHVLGNWDTFKEIVQAHPRVDMKIANRVLEEYEEQQISGKVYECFKHGKGVVVTIHGNDYAVSSHTTGNADEPNRPQIYGTDTLPNWIRGKVGMLKLVENGHILRDVGYRLKDNVFFVVRNDDE